MSSNDQCELHGNWLDNGDCNECLKERIIQLEVALVEAVSTMEAHARHHHGLGHFGTYEHCLKGACPVVGDHVQRVSAILREQK